MDLESPQPGSLSGSLLLASPHLMEPTFRRSIILISKHSDEEGALGYILNRPLTRTVGDLVSDTGFSQLDKVPVYMGGPVGQEHLSFASMMWDDVGDKLQFHSHLSAQEASRHLSEGFNVRAFVGYSGWTGGQLEAELEEEAWVVKEAMRTLTEAGQMNEKLWGELIRDVSPLHRLAADMPDDLSMN